MATLGWIGLGDIGLPMALRLIGGEHRVLVWARTAARLEPAVAAGAVAVATPAELAAQCEAVMLCVTDGDAVEEVVFGDRGLADGAPQGTLIVDHSTIHPEETRSFAVQVAEQGIGWVDAPVSGGSAGAKTGSLSCFLGGSAADVARVKPWIAAYTQNVTHMGPVGSGQIAKSCNQAVVASSVAIWAEVIAYARRCGLDPAAMVDALAGGWADSAVRQAHGQNLVAGKYRPAMTHLMLKDLEIVGDMASATSSPMPVASAVTTLYRMLKVGGHESGGPTSIMQLYDADAKAAT
ncbi:MAG TPA: NAD(P)-dependent oxidoreductase [Candidatus Elarobacter sp.]|jgi:3-hydroxyisobutyrate dehydrogenase